MTDLTPITLDFEAYFSTKDKYSLKHMPGVLYIRDPRFFVQGVGIKVGEQPTRWFTGDAIRSAIETIDWQNSVLVGHNLNFDGRILYEHYGIQPARYCDTLGMARATLPIGMNYDLDTVSKALGHTGKIEGTLAALNGIRDLTPLQLASLGEYCIEDVEATYHTYSRLIQLMPESELELLSVVTRMGCIAQFELDQNILEEVVKSEQQKTQDAVSKSGLTAAELSSNQQFAQWLEEQGLELPMKLNTKGEQIPALGQADAEYVKFQVDNPDLQHVFEARKRVKSRIQETRAKRFLEIARTKLGTLPMPYKYYGANNTGRLSGDEGLNVQNLPRSDKSRLREAMRAPKGMKVCAADSAQIELRTQLWFSGQTDMLNKLVTGQDTYVEMAASIFNVPESEVTKVQRGVGKAASLGLQFRMGANKFRAYMAGGPLGLDPIFFTEDEAFHTVNVYRSKHPATVETWATLDNVLPRMAPGYAKKSFSAKLGPVECRTEGIILPNGMRIKYPALREDGEGSWMCGVNGLTKFLHGGVLLENCLAEGTLVLTDSGWKPIETVTQTDLVHDGVEWINQGGALFRGPNSTCVKIDGVYMTPDHEVLTDEGWKTASTLPKPHRPNIRPADCNISGTQRRAQTLVEFRMPVRSNLPESGNRGNQSSETRRDPELRMPDRAAPIKTEIARDELASRLLGMEEYARPLPPTIAPRMEKLRRTRNHCLRTLGNIVRSLLGRHGSHLSPESDARPDRQQRKLLPRELPLGASQSTSAEPQILPAHRHSQSGLADSDQQIHTVLPMEARPVYDILNAGPRQRFVVLGDAGPFIVHNCVQALARIIVMDQLMIIDKEIAPVIGTTHDEVIALAPENRAEEITNQMVEAMRIRPSWAQDLPLDAEGDFDDYYCK